MAPAAGPRPVPAPVRVTALASPEAWAEAGRRLAPLEAAGRPEAWAGTAWQEALWRLHGHPPTWLVEVAPEADGPDAALILRTVVSQTPVGRVKVLRSADWHVMRMAPWLVRPGREAAAARTLLEAGPLLARRTGARFLRLFKLDAAATAPLQAALEEEGRPYRLLPMAPSPVVRLPDDFDAWLAEHGRKSRYNLRRSRRKLAGDLGGEFRVRGFRPPDDPARAPDPALRRAWAAFLDLQRRKLERARAAGEGHGPEPEAVLAAVRHAAAAWARRGWLELLVLEGGGHTAAAQVQLVHPERTWVVWMAYDAELARWSPGRLLFLDSLELAHRVGVRLVELGASGEEWKGRWCNGAEPVLRLEWALGGWQGILWNLGRRLEQVRRRAA